MDFWTFAWIGWLLIFAVLEAIALVRKKRGDTLSENTWRWFSLKGDKGSLKWWQSLTRLGFMAFWAWLTIHFFTGGSWL